MIKDLLPGHPPGGVLIFGGGAPGATPQSSAGSVSGATRSGPPRENTAVARASRALVAEEARKLAREQIEAERLAAERDEAALRAQARRVALVEAGMSPDTPTRPAPLPVYSPARASATAQAVARVNEDAASRARLEGDRNVGRALASEVSGLRSQVAELATQAAKDRAKASLGMSGGPPPAPPSTPAPSTPGLPRATRSQWDALADVMGSRSQAWNALRSMGYDGNVVIDDRPSLT